MAGKSDYLENKILEHVLKNTAYTSPTTVYAGLYTAAPTDAGGGTEVSGNNYSRAAATFGAASGGAIANSAAVTFPTPSGSWGSCTHFGIFDAATTGNLLYWAALTTPQTPLTGNGVEFAIGEIDITED